MQNLPLFKFVFQICTYVYEVLKDTLTRVGLGIRLRMLNKSLGGYQLLKQKEVLTGVEPGWIMCVEYLSNRS